VLDESEPDVLNLDLGYWTVCPAASIPALAQRLCHETASGVDPAAFSILRNILQAGVSDNEALCVIDATIVRSLRECMKSPWQMIDVAAMVNLMRNLADNWTRQGVFERAEPLYRHANAMLENVGDEGLAKLALLKAWTRMEIERGVLQRARELAAQHTALARKH